MPEITLGFVGMGAIAEAMVRGLCGPGKFSGRILVTERTRTRSARLASEFPNVEVRPLSQSIADDSDWIIVAVRPEQARAVLSDLRFKAGQCVVSVVAGLGLDDLRLLVLPVRRCCRANPLPPIENGVGPVLLCPPDAEVAQLFDRVGNTIRIPDESHYSTAACAGAFMATQFEYVATVARWLGNRGLEPHEATRYATSLVHALATMTLKANPAELQHMSQACLTRGGLNEQVLRELQLRQWFGDVEDMLGAIHARLTSRPRS